MPPDNPPPDSPPAARDARAAIARLLLALPAPVRAAVWRGYRDVSRWERRRRESRGDFSRSTPALEGMDLRLAELIGIRGGFFVEAGANDGYHQSNTYFLERARGWRGVLIEPVPFLCDAARRERPGARVFNCALVSRETDAPSVELAYGGMMTTVVGARSAAADDRRWAEEAHAVVQEAPPHTFRVPARTLSSILEEVGAPEVDLLSLDVEGFECEVLRGLDLDAHAPRWFLVELREGATSRTEVEELLADRYTFVEWLSPFDALYRRSDLAA